MFTQPKSGGEGDCNHANNPGNNQNATEEALPQGQAGAGLPLPRLVRQGILEHKQFDKDADTSTAVQIEKLQGQVNLIKKENMWQRLFSRKEQ